MKNKTPEDTPETIPSKCGPLFIFGFVAVFAIFIVLAYCYKLDAILSIKGIYDEKEMAKIGQLGDYFGGILNPIVGIATICLILISIRMQRQELTDTRAELKNSSAALNKQVAIATLQGFEQSFFSWLSNYRSLVNSISTDPSQEEIEKYQGIPVGNPLSGLNALAYLWGYKKSKKSFFNIEKSIKKVELYRHMNESTQSEVDIDFPYELKEIRERVKSDWADFYKSNGYQVDGLFRTLISLIEWIDKHEQLSKQQKWHYVGIVVAQLSQLELNLLFFYSISINGKTVRPLIEKFALLQHLNSDDRVINQLRMFGPQDGEMFSPCAYDVRYAKNCYPETP